MQLRREWLPSPRTCDLFSLALPLVGVWMVFIMNVTALLMLDDVSSGVSDSDGGY